MLYPLRFKEILRNYSFGNRRIPQVFDKRGLPQNHTLAETWEVCDRKNESSVLLNGALKGRTLHQLIKRYKAVLLGKQISARFNNTFPLLIKFLDASNPLGEQAHHSDILARKRGLSDPGKTEAWYMLKTRPRATLHCGNKNNVTRRKLLKALLKGNSRSCMWKRPVKPGQAFLLYAGTMHYSKGGLLFYEIMQNSDVYIGLGKFKSGLSRTQKIKQARLAVEGVHLENGFDCATRPVTFTDGDAQRSIVLACDYFALERLDLKGACTLNCDGKKFFVLTQIQGQSTIIAGKYREKLLPGNSCLLPADLGEVRIVSTKKSSLLKAYVPDLKTDIVTMLRSRGIKNKDILALGGHTRLNPLKKLLKR